ncbi:MAG: ATP-grasp domain-containing protein [Flavobacteriales bacterium]|nr:ATP-grasp domain-containing protein [Flavobacteriales bacterium]
MTRPFNILVTGVGAIIGYGIIESLRLSVMDCRIIGTDIYEENYGRYISDLFVQVPLTNSPEYSEVIQRIIREHNVDLIMPGIEQDVFFFNAHRSEFKVPIVLNDAELVTLSLDKWAMYVHLSDAGFPDLIPTRVGIGGQQAVELIGYPFIVKPKTSYASKGFHVIRNEDDLKAVEPQLNASTLYQPLVGSAHEEYSVSVFGDGKGGMVDHLILRRYLSVAGASEKAFVIKDDKVLMDSIQWLVGHFKPIGPTNFQYRKSDGRAYLLEINPRVSSACSIRSKFGYNEPQLSIEHYLIDRRYTITEKQEGKAIRFIADKVVYG